MQLSNQQQTIVDTIAERCETTTGPLGQIIKISGGAGTGKSTLIKALVEHLNDGVVVTPTHKAAQVLQDRGVEATTLHSKFFTCREHETQYNADGNPVGMVKDADDLDGEVVGSGEVYDPVKYVKRDLIFVSCASRHNLKPSDRVVVNGRQGPIGLGFETPHGKRHYAKTIVLDEASMVSEHLMNGLRQSCHHLIVIGDEKQLPPVADMRKPKGVFCQMETDFTLTENFRNATNRSLTSALAQLAKYNNGRKKEVWACIPHVPFLGFQQFYLEHHPTVICFKNKTRWKLNALARIALGIDPTLPPQIGEPVVFHHGHPTIRNSTRGTVVASSTTQLVIDIGRDKPTLVTIPLDKPWSETKHCVQLGYTITAHKAQGSEYPLTLVCNESGILHNAVEHHNAVYEAKLTLEKPQDVAIWQENKLTGQEMTTRWTYTALTRGQTIFAMNVPSNTF